MRPGGRAGRRTPRPKLSSCAESVTPFRSAHGVPCGPGGKPPRAERSRSRGRTGPRSRLPLSRCRPARGSRLPGAPEEVFKCLLNAEKAGERLLCRGLQSRLVLLQELTPTAAICPPTSPPTRCSAAAQEKDPPIEDDAMSEGGSSSSSSSSESEVAMLARGYSQLVLSSTPSCINTLPFTAFVRFPDSPSRGTM